MDRLNLQRGLVEGPIGLCQDTGKGGSGDMKILRKRDQDLTTGWTGCRGVDTLLGGSGGKDGGLMHGNNAIRIQIGHSPGKSNQVSGAFDRVRI